MTGKPTKGPWFATQPDYANGWWVVNTEPDGSGRDIDDSGDGGFEEPNARLIAEAGTVYHETGLTPRQLAELRAELLEAAKAAHEWIDMEGGESSKIYAQLSAIIAKAEGVQ